MLSIWQTELAAEFRNSWKKQRAEDPREQCDSDGEDGAKSWRANAKNVEKRGRERETCARAAELALEAAAASDVERWPACNVHTDICSLDTRPRQIQLKEAASAAWRQHG